MKKSAFVFLLVFVLTSGLHAQEKPNIVLFFIDDWAWNGTPVQMDDEVPNSYFPSILHMPNMQQLAAEGMIFSNAYAGAPQCSPSRVALQTGQSSPRNGFTVYMNDGGSDYYDPNPDYAKFPVVPCVSDMTIDPDAITIPEALAPHGYASAHFGKWHMRGHPDDEGYLKNDGDTDNNDGNENIPGDPKRMFSVTDSAIAFITDQVMESNPFYVQLSHYAMHEGRECLPETRAKYQAMPELKAYYKSIGETPATIRYKADPAVWLGMGEDLDGRIGAVLDTIKKLGIDDNTYVILTSDNGYREDFYEDLLRLPQPLHGAKWWLWQGGLRVAMIARGPDIPAGSVCDENVVNYDFLPTFVEWAGGSPATELSGIDGVSLASLMRGETPEPGFSDRTLYFHYPHYRTSMPHSVAISGDKKVVHFYEQPDVPMFFDIAGDIGEVSNTAAEDPVGHQALFGDMMQYLDDVGARIPLYPNPDYDSLAYASADEYFTRLDWGPFTGERELDEDEVISRDEKLYQHLIAVNKASIVTDGSGKVSAWNDQTINDNNAVAGVGAATYPSEVEFESGLNGVDFGSANTTLDLFSSVDSDSLLDFNGAVSYKDGFAVSLVFRPHTIKEEWCYLAGNATDPADLHSFVIGYDGSGIVEASLGGLTLQCTEPIAPDQTVVLVANYNATSGAFTLVSSSGDSLSVQVGEGDFSSDLSLSLGGIGTATSGFFDGLIGEVKVYDLALSNEQVKTEMDELLINWTEPAEEQLVQHLDATVEESIITDASGLVSTWMDLSGNENHAVPFGGALYYPASSTSATGLEGVDFGNAYNRLTLFTAEASDALLDFTGEAARNSGITVLMAFRIDQIIDNQNDVLGNNSTVDDINGFGMRYDSDGQPRVFIGGQKIGLSNQLQAGETVIYAVNYNKSRQLLTFWNSSTGATETVTVAPDDFSNSDPLTLGACNGNKRFLFGMVGEAKIFNYALSDENFSEEYTFLTHKWVEGFPPPVAWLQDPLYKPDANVDSVYSDSITHEDFSNPEHMAVRFSKVSGPPWLSLSEAGLLSGTPSQDDIGENAFIIQAEYDENSTLQATLLIDVVSNATSLPYDDQGALKAYPNPVDAFITIEGIEEGTYEIYTMHGIRLLEGMVGKPVNVSMLRSGMYILNVHGQVMRFIKNE
jgi:arylsulfatase A-like enzyme